MIRLNVTHTDGTASFHPVPPEEGWRLDPRSRCLVIGHGVPRTHVPLDNVLYFELTQHEEPDPLERFRRPRTE